MGSRSKGAGKVVPMPPPAATQSPLSPEEADMLAAKRAQDAAIKACGEEINAVLVKYGMTLQVQSNPQIVLMPGKR